MSKKQELYNYCIICESKIKTTEYRRRKNHDKCCSRKCYYLSRIGKKQCSETIAKRVAKNTGKKRTEALKDKMSKILKGRFTGKMAAGYIDGRTKDKEHLRQRNRKYHARRRIRDTFAGELTVKTIQKIYEENIQHYGTLTCHYCKEPIEFGNDHLEHKTPVSRGGTNKIENLTVACQSCNCSKNVKTEQEFFHYLVENKL